MKGIAFSNIAWAQHDDPAVWALLRSHGVGGIEVAPTKVWPHWEGASVAAAAAYRQRLHDAGFAIPALQAVLFGQAEARLFCSAGEQALEAHLAKVAALGHALGARVAVWGAPRQRDRGTLGHEQAMEHATPLCTRLAKIFADHGMALCIEPNPRAYDCNFVWNAAQGIELVKRVAHPGFGLHLDSAGMLLEGDSLAAHWPEAGPWLRHFHISEPHLGDFAEPRAPHAQNLATLRAAGYAHWASVEMRPPQAPLERVGPWKTLRELAHA